MVQAVRDFFLHLTHSSQHLLGAEGFVCGSADKESACNAGDLGSIPGLGRPSGEGNSYPLQYSGLEDSMDCIACGVAKSPTRLSDFPSLCAEVVRGNKTALVATVVELSLSRNVLGIKQANTLRW